MNNSIFITYNPKSELERTLAIRLHTIGAVNGFQMYLPDRYNGTAIVDAETKYRIANSSWFVLFATEPLSPIVLGEINHALINHDPARIIIIYNASIGKRIHGPRGCTEISFDPRTQTVDQVVSEIITKVWQDKIRDEKNAKLTQDLIRARQERNGLAALLGVGLGLFALSVLSEEPEEGKKKSKKKK